MINGVEFFVHHEDLRRGQPDWEPRVPDPERDAALWKTLRMTGRLAYRHSPVGIALRRTDGEEIVIKRGPNTVTIVGEPGELLLNAAGRSAVRVSFNGDQASIGIVQVLDRSL